LEEVSGCFFSHWASRPIDIAQNATGKGFVYKPCANWRNGKTKGSLPCANSKMTTCDTGRITIFVSWSRDSGNFVHYMQKEGGQVHPLL
jgi:hypothetical protein